MENNALVPGEPGLAEVRSDWELKWVMNCFGRPSAENRLASERYRGLIESAPTNEFSKFSLPSPGPLSVYLSVIAPL